MTEKEYKTAFTYENLSALETALVKGVRRVKYSDKEIEYRTIAEMIAIRNAMVAALQAPTVIENKGLFGGRRKVARHSKGLTDGSNGNFGECFNGYGDHGDI